MRKTNGKIIRKKRKIADKRFTLLAAERTKEVNHINRMP